MNPLYRIRNWDTIYENHDSKKCKSLSWLPLPVNLSGDGYCLIVEQKDGAALYGAFIAVLAVAADCTPRGTLIRSNGSPHTASSLSRKTRLPSAVVDRMLRFCVSPEIKWVEEAGNGGSGESPGTPGESPGPSRLQTDRQTDKTDRTDRTDKHIYMLFDYWLQQPTLLKHHNLTPQMQKAVEPTLKAYDLDELKAAALNYEKVLAAPRTYWYSYKHTFDGFFRKGIQKAAPFRRFLDESEPLTNLKNRDGFDDRTQLCADIKNRGTTLKEKCDLDPAQLLRKVNQDFGENYKTWAVVYAKASIPRLQKVLIMLESYTY